MSESEAPKKKNSTDKNVARKAPRTKPQKKKTPPLTYNALSDNPEELSHYIYAPSDGRQWPEPSDSLRNNYFSKLGGSSIKSRTFLHCLANANELPEELKETVAFFKEKKIGGRSAFSRSSLAAEVGWSLFNLRIGSPYYDLREHKATKSRYVLLFFGGNDVQGKRPPLFAARMMEAVERALRRGAIPIMASVMPRRDSKEMDDYAERYSQVAKMIAEKYKLVFIDFFHAAHKLPRLGVTKDGVHPNVFREGGKNKACDFSEKGMKYGSNLRNYLTVLALKEARRIDGAKRPRVLDEAGETKAMSWGQIRQASEPQKLPEACQPNTKGWKFNLPTEGKKEKVKVTAISKEGDSLWLWRQTKEGCARFGTTKKKESVTWKSQEGMTTLWVEARGDEAPILVAERE